MLRAEDVVTAPSALRAWLASSVHAVAIEDDLVFLDLRNDAYFCLAGAAGDLRIESGARGLSFQGPALREELCAHGLATIAEHAPQIDARLWPGPTTRSLMPPSTPPIEVADVADILAGTWDVFRRYRRRSLPELIAVVRAGTVSPADVVLTPELEAEVARFHRWVLYAPVSGKCLLRAFLLLRTLHRAGLDALWVFGVSTWPFQAHCWLQVGDTVLDDTFERVGAYTPILVV